MFMDKIKATLPKVRGRYQFNVPLEPITWFRVGGPAQVVFKPADVEDLCFFLQNCPSELPITTMGVGSNLLVRDAGVEGVVIRLGQGFTNVFVDDTTIDVGAGVLDRNIAMIALDSELEDFEFLAGIPGTLGGALRMNAGAYGAEIADILVHARVVDSKGKIHTLTPQELDLSYRHSSLPKSSIFIGARLKGRKGNVSDIQERMAHILDERESSQPVKSRTGGSTFANPPGKKAWELIDEAGCRGLTVGGAMMSELHCNFMINTGSATASDLETLGEEVKRRVLETSGISLRWEIERIGSKSVMGVEEKVA